MSLYSNTLDLSTEGADFIRHLPLFKPLNQQALCQVAEYMQKRAFAPGVILFHQDMPGMMLYIIESGWIRLFSLGRTGQELTLSILGPGDICGELSTMDNKYHAATAITLAPAVMWLLPRNELDNLLDRYPAVTRAMAQILVARIRATINHAEAMTFQDVLGRLAYEILYLADRHGEPDREEIAIQVPLTQADLASMVGATRESVNKALATLRSQELVKMIDSRLVVMHVPGLRQILNERGR
ncbi:MAG TPA: Crp/Fnr family transcriptional regulator [Anaerolineales bacterium]|nr:Crp/Fnr family transcriptional regulator [Anaerolineales bacterium]